MSGASRKVSGQTPGRGSSVPDRTQVRAGRDSMRWWRGFVDKLSGGDRGPGQAPVGPRRREDPRYLFEVRLRAKCPSWPNLLELFTGDLSAGGMFIPTRVAAAVGERVELELELPHGGQLAL